MIGIPGYKILTQIYESANSLVHKSIREVDNKAVIIKTLKEDYPSPQILTRYQQEYEITKNLNLEGVIKALSLEKYGKSLAIIFEDVGSESLAILMNSGRLNPPKSVSNLEYFLKKAIKTTEILGAIHSANIIHKDINPSNIIINPETEEIKIIDFGISSVLTRENPSLKNPNVLEGTLAYISPEQTGRMNRALDYRSDYYSLGVTFYQLLTGKLPFDTEDALELVHCHIAKQPEDISNINPQIPQVISQIVIKLMAKNAENRYQSFLGIKEDLEACLNQLQATGEVSEFILGTKDVSDKFQIPQKLYGREAEIELLLTAFERVTNAGKETILVRGYSGIGKSALVQVLYQPITAKRGYFISGKFDQYQRNIPYSSIISAFEKLVEHLLTETSQELKIWREKILLALGQLGQVIIDVIPEIELIIGKPPEVPSLPPAESQNRLNLVFQKFISVFTQPEHPLALFIDDLQWADGASLKLLESIIANAKPGLFFIGAYRDNEVSEAHPLMLTLKNLEETGVSINNIALKSLALPTVNQLIADTLKCSQEKTLPLAELVAEKTGGNPFFLTEFLKSLSAEELLHFDYQEGSWKWDLEQIQGRKITDNVVELMAGKIKKLPEQVQDALKLAACIGNQFELSTLAVVAAKSPKETALSLHAAMLEGLIVPLNDAYKTVELGVEVQPLTPTGAANTNLACYQFVHDRVQQAAYVLIPPESKQLVHRQVGQLLLQNTPSNQIEEKIFAIVNQLNKSIDLINTQPEKNELAKLNLIAGKKAKASAAYQPAFEYLKIAMTLLAENSWHQEYELTLAVYAEGVESAYLSRDFSEMERLAEIVLQQGTNLLDKVKVYECTIPAYQAQAKQLEAIKNALSVFKLLGVFFPEQPTAKEIQQALEQTASNLGEKPIENLIDLPAMTDLVYLAEMRILASASTAAFQAAPMLFSLIILEMVNLSIKQGNSALSAFAYAGYGTILCSVVGDIETGYQFGKLALSLLSRFDDRSIKAKTIFIVYDLVIHWKEHIKATLEPLLSSYTIGVENGDLEFASVGAQNYCEHSFYIGRELKKCQSEMAAYAEAIANLKQITFLNYLQIYRQSILNLLEPLEKPWLLNGIAYDETRMLPVHLEASDRTGIYVLYLNKLILAYLFDDHQEALDNSLNAAKYIDAALGLILVPLFYFYDSLTRLAIANGAEITEKDSLLKQVNSNQEKMQKWAHHAPSNYQHKFYLVEAERHRVLGENALAREEYDVAIELAKENEYLNDEALANELAAKFYLAKGKTKIAQVYLQEARYCYQTWGAEGKVKYLDKTYPQLLIFSQTTGNKNTKVTQIATISSSVEILDLATVMKASQTISREIVLDKLLASLMKIIIENAGAQVGYLILEKQGKLLIDAVGFADSHDVNLLKSTPIEKSDNLSLTIVNYVARTKESVVLSDAGEEELFANDSYIKKAKPKSVLCKPIINQGQLIGILYLENNLTCGAFTLKRLEFLNIFSSQAAISIKNAILYAEMTRLNQDLEKSLEAEIKLAEATERFVPNQFLSFLGYDSIVNVRVGDGIEQEMSILFSDIRSFTTLSETMTPQDSFQFINSYLSFMEPAIIGNNGFIDKYIGDAIMALFGGSADDAVKAGISMLDRLKEYNQQQLTKGQKLIDIGIGINTGKLMLGTVGGSNRMDGTVIGDTVNLASRMESLTKNYQVPFVITHHTYKKLANPDVYHLRKIDRVKVKGKSELVTVYEVFDGDLPELKDAKLATLEIFQQALLLYDRHTFPEAALLLEECLRINPHDKVAQIYRDRCLLDR